MRCLIDFDLYTPLACLVAAACAVAPLLARRCWRSWKTARSAVAVRMFALQLKQAHRRVMVKWEKDYEMFK
jgi:hypothetical protein